MALICTTTTDNIGDATGQYVLLGLTDVNIRASHTIMVRVKSSSTATNYYSTAVGYTSQSDFTGSFLGRFSGNGSTLFNWRRQAPFFNYTQDNGTAGTCYGNTSTWYHVALVYNATTGQIRKYVDGAFVSQHASATTRTSSSTSNYFAAGGHQGRFADAALFNRALSDGEVASMAAYRQPQVTSGLRVFWRLDSDGTDSSGNGNNGSVSGTAPNASWSTADNPPQPETPTENVAASGAGESAGTAAVAYKENVSASGAGEGAGVAAVGETHGVAAAGASTGAGAAAYAGKMGWGAVVAPGSALLRASPPVSRDAFTLMMWLRCYDDQGGFTWATLGASQQCFIANNEGSVSVNANGTGVLVSEPVAAGWHHVAMTSDGATVRAYIDGVEAGSSAVALAGTFDGNLFVSSFGGASGEYANIKLWGSVLSESEIASERIYHTPHTALGSQSGWWPLDGTRSADDESGNGYNFGAPALDPISKAPGQLYPPITATGGGVGAGTAAVSADLTLNVAASGASEAFGTATVNARLAVAAAGASAGAGTATVAARDGVVGSGAGEGAGSATVGESAVVVAAGSSSGAGSATVGERGAAAAVGAGTGAGTAALGYSEAVAASGSGVGAGAAAVGERWSVAAAGASSGAGAAAVREVPNVSAVGSGQGAGTASVSSTARVQATGAGVGSSVANVSTGAEFAVSATGASSGAGTASVGESASIAASGGGTSAGAAVVGEKRRVIATGASSGAGTADVGAGLTFNVAASGAGQGAGSSSVAERGSVEASGPGLGAGSASVAVIYRLVATGPGEGAGTADVSETIPELIAANGGAVGAGTAAVSVTLRVVAGGAGVGRGIAAVSTNAAPSGGGSSAGGRGRQRRRRR